MTTLAQPKDSLEVCYSNILVVSRTLGMLVIIEEDQLCCSNLSREESSVLLYCDTFFATYLEHLCQLPSANQRPPLCKTVLIGIIDAAGKNKKKTFVVSKLVFTIPFSWYSTDANHSKGQLRKPRTYAYNILYQP